MQPRYHTPIFHIFVTLFCFVFLGTGITVMAHQSKKPAQYLEISETFITKTPDITYDTSVFNDLILSADSFLVFDITNNKEIFSRNADVQKPIASLTKIVSTNVILETIPKETTFTITPYAENLNGMHGLQTGDIYTRDELLELGLGISSNTAMATITDDTESFVSSMNTYAKRITGRDTMYFRNTTGLDTEENQSGGVGTAYDVLDVLRDGTNRFPEIFTSSIRKNISITGKEKIFPNTNITLGHIPSVRSSKTGFTNRAGGTLAFIFEAEPGRVLGIIILDSTFSDRFTDAEKLVQATLQSIYSDSYDIN